MDGARFKGKLGMSVRKSVKTALGRRAAEPVIASLPTRARWLLTERFIATQWYPLEDADEMIEGVARAVGRDPVEVARQMGRDVAFETAGRVGRTVLNIFGSPQRIARYLGPMWGQLYDGGRIDATYDEATGILGVRLEGWPGHQRLVCITVLGSLESLSSHMNRPPLLSAKRTACVDRGAARCEFELRFDLR